MTPEERKAKVLKLREEHNLYLDSVNNSLYIPKMAYRPPGKDDLHITFFPSELIPNKDIYTEFVSIDYSTEDPKRTLYLLRYNPHWKSEYELITSQSGFQRHMIPVSELKVINDVTDRNKSKLSTAGMKNDAHTTAKAITLFDLDDPDETTGSLLVSKLEEINQTLITLTKVITKYR